MARPNGLRRWLFLLAGIFAAAPLWADGSLFGTLNGRVRDESGGALPGATIELTSAEKGLRRSAVSDAAGAFNFALLPPGAYTVKAALASFETFESTNNIVTSEKTTTVNMTLKLAATAETVTVLGDAPLVDKTNVSDTTRVESSLSDAVAIPRGYQTLIEFAPGLNDADADGNTNSHGAVDGSNLFLFDGVDTTDPTTGTFGANNNFDTIQEVVVSNSAISAEYGRAQGAVVNVISKSGTNIFHGSARALATNDNWNEQNKGSSPPSFTNPSGTPFARTKLNHNVYDYLFTLGGPAWKDHIWFFGAYERNPQFTPPAQVAISDLNPPPLSGQNYSASREFVAWQGKLTGQVTPSHALTFSAQADPFTGIIRNYWNEFGIPSAELQALTAQTQSDDCPWACIWQARYTGVFGANVSVEATYAQQRGGIQVHNEFPSPDFNGSPILDLREGYFYNGNPFDGFVERPRDQANLAVSIYNQLFGHAHNFKVGVDYQKIKSESSFVYPGNQIFVVSGFDAATRQMLLQPGDYWNQGTPPEESVSTGKIYGIYGLDRFEATDRLSFNVGVRVDVQDGKSDLRQAVVSATTVSPRVTGTYDVFGNGKTLASAAYGQYRDFLVQSLIDSIYSGFPQQTNFDHYIWNGSDVGVRVSDPSSRQRFGDQPGSGAFEGQRVQHLAPAADREHGGGRGARNLPEMDQPDRRRADFRSAAQVPDSPQLHGWGVEALLQGDRADGGEAVRQELADPRELHALACRGEPRRPLRHAALRLRGRHLQHPRGVPPGREYRPGRRGCSGGDRRLRRHPREQPAGAPLVRRDAPREDLRGVHVPVLVHEPDGGPLFHVQLGAAVSAAADFPDPRRHRQPTPTRRRALRGCPIGTP